MGGTDDSGAPAVAEPAVGHRPEWQWRTFPVFFAFTVGGIVMGLAASSALALPYFFVILFGAAFGVAHIITRMIVTRRRQQR